MVRPFSKPAIGPERAKWRHSGHTPRRNAGLAAYENVLARAGLSPVAGIDEAGRGACAGPLVVAAVVLDCATIRHIPGLADSKLLTPDERESVYADVMRWALDWHMVAIPPLEVDSLGLHVCNVEGMRRALAGLRRRPGYVLTDGFPVRGLGAPALAVWKGDQVTASVAAASVVAKVTRDRMMVALGDSYPAYGFARHKGYSTPEHMTALCAYGPCPEHRYSYTNVLQANRRWATGWRGDAADLEAGSAIEDDPAIEDRQSRMIRRSRMIRQSRTARLRRMARPASLMENWRSPTVLNPAVCGQISWQERWPRLTSAQPGLPGPMLHVAETKLGIRHVRRRGEWVHG